MRNEVYNAVLALVGAVAASVSAADPFAKFDDVPVAERLSRNAALEVAADGTFRVNGRPRYLTATLFYGGADECDIRTSGYPDDLRWLYEDIPGYEGLQRLGIDAAGFESGREWMRCISPTAAAAWKMSGLLPASPRFAPVFEGQLPAYVDFTPAEWGHGGLLAKDNPQLPADAWTKGRNHWVPYSIFHPDGRNIWFTMWREGVRRYARLPVKPYCYELMNEPSVLDTGDFARARFRETGRRDDPVEYLKFMDETFAGLIGEGAKLVHEIQPGAKATLQPLGCAAKGIDLYEIYRRLDVVCSPTGGGQIPMGHFLRAVADGKPIVDGETYVGKTFLSVRNALVKQYQRGFNASYTFKWSRRPRDWARKGDAKLEEPLARKVADYNYLNPYVVPTEALLGFRLAKRDAMDVGEFFVPRDRGTPRRVAVLYSKPTERLALVYNHTAIRTFDKVVDELEYAHLNPDVVLEEQLRDEPARLDRYAVLFAPGVEAVYPWTPAVVRVWQAKGGRLVLVGERMAKDEYGKPNGETYPDADFVETANVSAVELGRRLAALAVRAGVAPTCETRGVSRVEVTDACRDGLWAWIVTSREIEPQVCGFRPAQAGEMTIEIRNVRLADGRIVSRRRELQPDGEGVFTLLLEPNDGRLIVSGARADVLARYRTETVRDPFAASSEWLPPLSAAEAARTAAEGLSAYRRQRFMRKGGYRVCGARTTRLDLRGCANVRKLTDKQWGLHEVEGVPFSFIRTDQNFFKDAVALEERPVELPLAARQLQFYFALSGAIEGTLSYADGTETSFRSTAGADGAIRVWRWTNPQADRAVRGLRVKAAAADSVLYAVTVEAVPEEAVVIVPEQVAGVKDFGGGRLVPEYADGCLKMIHSATPSSWSGCCLTFKTPLALPEDRKGLMLAMEVNKLPNRYGAFSVSPGLQVAVEWNDSARGKKVGSGYHAVLKDDRATKFGSPDADPDSWETVCVELGPAVLRSADPLRRISFQYQSVSVADPSPLALRNLRFVRDL